MSASYAKLKSGEWGIRVTGKPRKGDRVTVIKKGGGVKTEIIRDIVWSGDEGISLCTIERSERPPSASRGNYRSHPSYSNGSSQRAVESTYRNRFGWDGVRGSASYYSSGMYDEES